MKKVFIIILHYQDKNMTANCLDSLTKTQHPGFQLNVLVVNNNPRENLADLRHKYSQFIFIKTSHNLGFAEGNNHGIREALNRQADFIMLLNNDTYVAADFLVHLIKATSENEEGGVFTPKIYFAPGFEFHKDWYKKEDQGKVIWFAGGFLDWANIATRHEGVDEVDQGQFNQLKEIDFISGCAMLIKREVFEKIGLLNSKYFLYYEDADFCQRAIRAGFKLFYVPKAVIWHQVSASSEIGGALQDYYLVRNQLLFGLYFAPWRSKLALIKQSLRFLIFGRPWQKQGVIDFYLGKFGQGSWNK